MNSPTRYQPVHPLYDEPDDDAIREHPEGEYVDWDDWQRLDSAARNLMKLLEDVGNETQWKDGQQSDRVFAWYEFDEIRRALGDLEPRFAGDVPDYEGYEPSAPDEDYDDSTFANHSGDFADTR
jgi:hypothetical protein